MEKKIREYLRKPGIALIFGAICGSFLGGGMAGLRMYTKKELDCEYARGLRDGAKHFTVYDIVDKGE